ncbi:MAG: hypothetical protein Q8Q95_00980 [bacterium]|nr:hypothetical protein [bacterium]
MPTQTLVKKFNKELGKIKEEMHEIKEFLFLSLKDSEGEYTDSFVKKMLTRSGNRGPFRNFKNKESFLKHVRSDK